MSLTDHLKSADSAVRIFLEGAFPLVGRAKGSSLKARAAAEILGLDRAASLERFVTLPDELPKSQWSGTIGTAFDMRARMLLGDLDLDTSQAAAGLSTLMSGTHEFQVFHEAMDVARALLQHDDPEKHDRATIALAWCESLARSPLALVGSLGRAVRAVPDGASLIAAAPQPVLDDLQRLRNVGGSLQIEAWRSAIQGGARYVPNPMFSAGEVVDGADGDWMIGDTLVDCKTTSNLNRSILRTYLLQLLGYVLLDENDDLGIRQVAVWLPRYGETFTWSLAELLGSDPQRALPALRTDFKRVVGNSARAVALHEEIPVKRVTGMISENRHTAVEHLETLASSEDVSVRMKVAGNPSTPTQTLIRLSMDTRWEVRAKVAGNPSTPEEVWERLKDDRSILVYVGAVRAQRGTAPAHTAELDTGCSPSKTAPKSRLRSRTGLVGWCLYWLENTERAGYLDFHWELHKFGMLVMSRRLSSEIEALRYARYRNGDAYTAEDERLNRAYNPEGWALWDAKEACEEPCASEGAAELLRPAPWFIPSLPSAGDLLRATSRDMALSEVERIDALNRLSRSSAVADRRSAAWNPNADMQMLLRLSTDKRAEVRAAVASNENTPVSILEFLSGERTARVRREALRNVNLPERVLRSLWADPAESDRAVLASHPNMPTDLLVELTESDSLLLCVVAALNPSTPIDTVRSMQDDPDPVVRKVVAATLVYRESSGDDGASGAGVGTGS